MIPTIRSIAWPKILSLKVSQTHNDAKTKMATFANSKYFTAVDFYYYKVLKYPFKLGKTSDFAVNRYLSWYFSGFINVTKHLSFVISAKPLKKFKMFGLQITTLSE